MSDPTREEALAHFGVRGQKWGVRNQKSKTSAKTSTVPKTIKAKARTALMVVVGATVAARVLIEYGEQQFRLGEITGTANEITRDANFRNRELEAEMEANREKVGG